MSSFQRQINLVHYNIWRFERWTRYLIFGDGRLTTIKERVGDELEDCVPFAVDSIDDSMLPNYSGKHFGILLLLLLLSILNVVSWLFGFEFSTVWFWGAVVCGILSFVTGFYLIPISLKTTEKNVLLDDFKVFETMSDSKKRFSGVISFFVVIAIWGTFIVTFGYYISSSIIAQNRLS